MNQLNYAAYTEQNKPVDFSFTMEGAGCCLIVDGKVLFLQRSLNNKIQPGKWGIPAGKLEAGEMPVQAAVRELREEAGIALDAEMMQYRGYIYFSVEYAVTLNYRFHVYTAYLQALPEVVLEPGQAAFCWVTYDAALQLPGFTGTREVLALGMNS